jgi:DnaJ-class molecular chaperone
MNCKPCKGSGRALYHSRGVAGQFYEDNCRLCEGKGTIAHQLIDDMAACLRAAAEMAVEYTDQVMDKYANRAANFAIILDRLEREFWENKL